MNSKLICLMLAFLTCFCVNCKADEVPSEPISDVEVSASLGRAPLYIYDISSLHTFLSERIEQLDKTVRTFPKKMNKDQKCFYWLHHGQMQAYKEMLSTIDLLQQNTQ
jgi:hypothetical protein